MSAEELKKDLDELPKKYKEAMDQLKALRADFIMSHLERPAKEEVQMYRKKDRSNPDFLLDVLTQAFGEKRSSSQFLKLFYGQKQKESEKLQAYSYSLNELPKNATKEVKPFILGFEGGGTILVRRRGETTMSHA